MRHTVSRGSKTSICDGGPKVPPCAFYRQLPLQGYHFPDETPLAINASHGLFAKKHLAVGEHAVPETVRHQTCLLREVNYPFASQLHVLTSVLAER